MFASKIPVEIMRLAFSGAVIPSPNSGNPRIKILDRAETTSADTNPDFAANLAVFLTEKTGSCLGTWIGRLSAAEQRALFGRFIGKGRIVIDGERETVCNRVKVCFGLDYDDRNVTTWRSL